MFDAKFVCGKQNIISSSPLVSALEVVDLNSELCRPFFMHAEK
jgi:hypothetical protein